jgi:protein SCO1/2
MRKYALIVVAGLLALGLAAVFFLRGGAPVPAVPAPALPAGADFVLQSAAGPVDSKALRGKVLLVYFGYANCPDICPASLAEGGRALNALTPEERQRVRLLMVSVDPERDTPEHLKAYTAFFHPEMTGVTGSPKEVARLAAAFGAGYVRQPSRADGTYAVDHTTSTYVVDRDGRLVEVLPLGATTDAVVAAVRKRL